MSLQPLHAPGPSACTMYKAATASAVDGMRETMGVFTPGQSPWTFHSLSRTLSPVEFTDELGSSFMASIISHLGAPGENELSIAATEGGPSDAEDLAGLLPTGVIS